MIRTYGSDALVTLIRSYADGRTDDEAFKDALGLDMTAFGTAWFKVVKATPKAKFGPQPAPPGPVPSAWAGAAPGRRHRRPPRARRRARGVASGPGASAQPGSVGGPAGTDGAGGVWLIVAIVAAIFVVAIVVAVRRRRSSEEPP